METVDVKNPTVKKFIEVAHHSITRRGRNLSEKTDKNFVFESRLFKLLCREKYLSARQCAEKFSEKYGGSVSEEDVIRTFRDCGIASVDSRKELFIWAAKTVDAFLKALLSQKRQDDEAYFEQWKEYEARLIKSKVFCLMLYVRHPELDVYGDLENLERFGRVFMKYLCSDLNSFLRESCGGQPSRRRRGSRSETENEDDMLIKDLQDDFEARLARTHQNEIAEFFSRLNSDRYGCILDTLINVRGGITKLRKQNVELPLEISGLFILIDNFIKFVRDNEINPVMKLGSVHEMKAGDIEACSGDYDGTPYASAKEVKSVKVLSPGWHYKDIQISRPRLKEYSGDEILDNI